MRSRWHLTLGASAAVSAIAAIAVLVPVGAHAAVRYLSKTSTVSGTGSVSCPYGSKVTGGGVGTLPGDYFGQYSSDEYKLTGSYPSGNGWRATATRVHGYRSSTPGTWTYSNWSSSPQVYAVCAS